eukprot:gene25727-30896_t
MRISSALQATASIWISRHDILQAAPLPLWHGKMTQKRQQFQRRLAILCMSPGRKALSPGHPAFISDGTGKTVSLQVLAEGFSRAGVPVFCADIKGDLSGIGAKGEEKDFLVKRAAEVRLDPY